MSKRLRISRKNFISDLTSGFAAGLFSIPEGMAYAKLMGVNPVYGLYSSMVAPIVASMATGTVLMISTLTSAIAISTGSVLQQAGIDVSSNPSALFTVTFLVGAIMFVFGLLKMGSLVNFVSNAVMTGFVCGASLLIIVGELGDLTGYAPSGVDKFMKIIDWAAHIGHWDTATTAVGIGTIISMIILKRVPQTEKSSAVIVLIFGTIIVNLLRLPSVELVGNVAKIPNGLPAMVLPDVNLVPKLTLGALSVALVALTQGAGIGTAVPNPDGSRSDQSRDFIGQGLGNLIGSFFQSLGTGGSLSRTGISVGAGAKTRLAGIFSGIWVILIVLLFGSMAETVPLSVIAGILVVVAVELIWARVPDIKLVFRTSKGSAAIGFLTFGSALFVPLQWTIFLGAGLSMILYIHASASHLRVYQLTRNDDGRYEEDEVPDVYPSGKVTVLHFNDLRFYAEVPRLNSLLPENKGVKNAVVILMLRYMETLPSGALKWLARYSTDLRESGNLLMLAGVEAHMMELMEHTHMIEAIGRNNIFPAGRAIAESIDNAIDSAQSWLLVKENRI
jgi:SulP family sulfate permease